MPVSDKYIVPRSTQQTLTGYLQVSVGEFQAGASSSTKPRLLRVDLAAVPGTRAFGNRNQFPPSRPPGKRRRVGELESVGWMVAVRESVRRGGARVVGAAPAPTSARFLSRLPTTARRDLRYVLRCSCSPIFTDAVYDAQGLVSRDVSV